LEFGEKLQGLRKSKNLTQEELAEALYVSRTAISKWESGRGYPNIDSLKEISNFFRND
jgi:transcriptional regulator with XRE-family HTH domain